MGLSNWFGAHEEKHAANTLKAAQTVPAKPLEQHKPLVGWQACPAAIIPEESSRHNSSESLQSVLASTDCAKPEFPCADDQRSLISKACDIARAAGWQLDDLGEWTMLRFLIKHNWRLDRAAPHIRSTAAWRQSVDADGIRRAIAAGLQPSQFPAMSQVAPYLLMMFTNLPSHEGDRMTFVDSAGVFDVTAFIGCATEDEISKLNLHVLEHMSFHNDRASAESGRLVRWSTHFDAAGVRAAVLVHRLRRPGQPIFPLLRFNPLLPPLRYTDRPRHPSHPCPPQWYTRPACSPLPLSSPSNPLWYTG
jgi:hypothetical protein